MNIAMLGLGAMGLPMAARLAEEGRGYEVAGFDPDESRRALAEKDGVATYGGAREAVDGCDVVIIAVNNEAQVRDLLFAPTGGIVDVLGEGSLVILTSTIGVSAAEDIAAQLAEFGIGMVDAPISGGPRRARGGDLLIVVGATDVDYEAAQSVLEALASSLVWVGKEAGKGQAMKTVNQLLCGVHVAAAAEAMALAGKLGLDQEMALAALMDGAAQSFMLGDRGPRLIQEYRGERADVGTRLDIFVKDLGIVTDAAQSVGIAVPVAAAAQQEYLTGVANGIGPMDDTALITIVAPAETC